MIQIIGARGEIHNVEETLKKAESYGAKKGVEIQLINAKMVFSKNHLYSAAKHAKRAFKKDKKQKLGIEILLYSSCERQISLAIKKMGIKKGNTEIAIVIIGKCDENDLLNLLGFKRDDTVLDGDVSILKNFGINNFEINITNGKADDLLLERIALLDLIK